jgi:hypothetical protein
MHALEGQGFDANLPAPLLVLCVTLARLRRGDRRKDYGGEE